MQPHQQRVIEEQSEVASWRAKTEERLANLQSFFDDELVTTLPKEERVRLRQQALIMGAIANHLEAYGMILQQRVEAFPEE